jgi:predicted  nucleic acid-binding Zn-ribbon protein
VLELKDGTLAAFDGNWSDYQTALEAKRSAISQQPFFDDGLTKTEAARRKRASREEEQRAKEEKMRVANIEKDIAQAEAQLKDIEEKLANPAVLAETELIALSNEHEAMRRHIEALLEKWETAHME